MTTDRNRQGDRICGCDCCECECEDCVGEYEIGANFPDEHCPCCECVCADCLDEEDDDLDEEDYADFYGDLEYQSWKEDGKPFEDL